MVLRPLPERIKKARPWGYPRTCFWIKWIGRALLAEGELDYLCLYFLATDLNGDLGLRLLVVSEDVAEGDALLERGRHGA